MFDEDGCPIIYAKEKHQKLNSYETQQEYLYRTGKISSAEKDQRIKDFKINLLTPNKKGADPQTSVKLLKSPVTNEQYQNIPENKRKNFRDRCISHKKELENQVNEEKITIEEANQNYMDFSVKLYGETMEENENRQKGAESPVTSELKKKTELENKAKGAVPKQKSEKPKIIESPKNQPHPLNKEEKFLHTHLNKNKLNCGICRKLLIRLLNDKTRIDGAREAEKHLESRHGIKIARTAPKRMDTPTSSDLEMFWDNSTQIGNFSSYYQTVVTSQDALGGDYPLLQPADNAPSNTDTENAERTGEDEGFKKPKKFSKRKASSPPTDGIPIKNPYQSLTDTEEDAAQAENMEKEQFSQKSTRLNAPPRKPTGNKASNPTTKTKKNELPPPIIMKGQHGKDKYNSMREQLEVVLSKGYTLRYTKNNTLIQAMDLQQYEQLKILLEQGNEEWHTYATQSQKTHAFVIKGLDNEPNIVDIASELKEIHGIEVVKIHPMQTKYRMLYLVVTPATVLLKHLKAKIKYLNHVSITWDLRKKYTTILQCKRCYLWGHSATFCRRSPRCSNCGNSHPITEEMPCNNEIKCANCGQDHKATDTKCSIYAYRTEKIEQQRKQLEQRLTKPFRDAPIPEENIWDVRRRKLYQQEKVNNAGYSSDEDSDEERQRPTASRAQRPATRLPQQQKSDNDTNVSEILELSKEFNALGNSLAEAVRFLRDFLTIFKMNKQEDRAFALLEIMIEIKKYKF